MTTPAGASGSGTGVGAALRAGLSDLAGRRKLWPALYLIQLCLAALVVLPLLGALLGELGHRPGWAARLAGGDLTILDELMDRLRAVRTALPFLLGGGLLVSLGLKVLLLGGVLAAVTEPQRCLSAADFGRAAAARFGPLLGVAAVFWVLEVIALGVGAGGVALAGKLVEEAVWPMAQQAAALAGLLPGAALLCFLVTAHDYARVSVVLDPPGGAVGRVLLALRFVLRFPASLLLHLGSMGLGLLLLGLAAVLTSPLGALGLAAVVAFLIRQGVSFGRVGVHLARYRSVVVFRETRQRPATPAPAPAPAAPVDDLCTM